MPADSDPSNGIVLPHTWRPFGARIAASVGGACLLIVCVVAWFGIVGRDAGAVHAVPEATMVGLFGLGFLVWFALVRSRVVAEEDRLVVVNGYRTHVYEWAEVVSITPRPRGPVGDPRPLRRHHDVRARHPGIRR